MASQIFLFTNQSGNKSISTYPSFKTDGILNKHNREELLVDVHSCEFHLQTLQPASWWLHKSMYTSNSKLFSRTNDWTLNPPKQWALVWNYFNDLSVLQQKHRNTTAAVIRKKGQNQPSKTICQVLFLSYWPGVWAPLNEHCVYSAVINTNC